MPSCSFDMPCCIRSLRRDVILDEGSIGYVPCGTTNDATKFEVHAVMRSMTAIYPAFLVGRSDI